MTTGADGTVCHCDHGWVVDHRKAGPVVDGKRTVREFVRPCRACRPDTAARVDAGVPRIDPAIDRHRRNRDRITGRTDD